MLIRVIFAVAVVFTGGLALFAYPVLWFLMPEEGGNAPAWPTSQYRPPTPPPTAEGTTPIDGAGDRRPPPMTPPADSQSAPPAPPTVPPASPTA